MQAGKRKKILGIAGVAALAVLTAALGVTLAVLTKGTEKRANVFTFGNVQIELTEEKWDELEPEDTVVYPGRTVSKDPKVTNSGKNDLYAYIEIWVPMATVRTVAEDGVTVNAAASCELFAFTPNDGWEELSPSDWEEERTSGGSRYRVYLYGYTAGTLAPGESTATLFDSVTYANVLEGELEKDAVLKMPVYAYAIQSDYLNETGSGMKEKMTEAFGKYKAAETN